MQSEKEKVALTSIAISAGLTVAKAVVGFLSGSLALLSEAAHSLIDCLATDHDLFRRAHFRQAGRRGAPLRPRQGRKRHRARRDRAAVRAVRRGDLGGGIAALFGGHGHAVEATLWAFGVIVVSIVVDFFRARLLYRVAHETASEALEADALHFGSDMWSSIAVLIGLCAVAAGFPWADAAAALVVAVFVCVAGWRLGRRTIDTLTDTAPAGSADAVTRAADARARRGRGRAASGCGRSATSCSSRSSLAVSRSLPLDRVELLKREVADAIRAALPRAEVSVATAPRALDNETVIERVMVIARNQALAVHHVTVHDIRGKLSVSLDLEVDHKLPLGGAHDIADRLEAALREELGTDVEVETHIEPLQADAAGREAHARAHPRGASRRSPRSPPRAARSATFTTSGCAKPTRARSSTSIAGSIRR